MNLAELIKVGPLRRAHRVVLYGSHGIGKSTLASQFPHAIFLDCEDGTAELNVVRIQISSFKQFTEVSQALLRNRTNFQTVVIDSIDALEKFLRIQLCLKQRKEGLEDFGYGKGYQYLLEEFERLLDSLDAFIAAGIHVVVVGHSVVKRVYLPELSDPFDRYELRIYDRCAARLREWADAVLFLNWNTRVQESAWGRMRGIGGKERVIYTTHSVAYDAKNRINLPEKLPCEFSAIAPLIAALTSFSTPSAKDPAAPLPAEPTTRAQDQLAAKLADLNPDWVTGFLIDREQILPGQTIAEAPSAYCEQALKRIETFRRSVIAFGQEKEKTHAET